MWEVKMNCKSIKNYYLDYREKTLAPPERRRFEDHLRNCARCYDDYQAYGGVCDLLGNLPRETAPMGFSDRIRFALRSVGADGRAKTRLGWEKIFSPASFAYLVPAVGAVIIILFAFALIQYQLIDETYRGGDSAVSAKTDLKTEPLATEEEFAHLENDLREIEALVNEINALSTKVASKPIFVGGDDSYELVFDPYQIYKKQREPIDAAKASYTTTKE